MTVASPCGNVRIKAHREVSIVVKTATRPSRPRTDAIEAFFAELTSKGREPLLQQMVGTIRIDLEDKGTVERWYLSINKGDVSVSHRNARADAVVRGDKALFELVMTGRTNAMAAVLRGALVLEGDYRLAARVERLFPGPPSSFREPEPAVEPEAASEVPRRPSAKAAGPKPTAVRKGAKPARPPTTRKGSK